MTGRWCSCLSSSLLEQQKGDDPAMIQQDTRTLESLYGRKTWEQVIKQFFNFLIMNVEDYTCRISLFSGYPWQPAHGKYSVGVRLSTAMRWCVACIEKNILGFKVSKGRSQGIAVRVQVFYSLGN